MTPTNTTQTTLIAPPKKPRMTASTVDAMDIDSAEHITTPNATVDDMDHSEQHVKEEIISNNNISTTLQQAIITVLSKTPDSALLKFFMPTTTTFKAIFGTKDLKLVIWRKGVEVFVGVFEHHPTLKAYRFAHLAGFLIGYDGAWHIMVTAKNAYSSTKWNDVWVGKFESYGGVERMSVQVDEKGMEKTAGDLAIAVLEGKWWEGKVDLKCT